MIDIKNERQEFKKYIFQYKQDKLGYDLKVIATLMNLSEEDIKLAEIIALLHDIGRFEELK